MAKATFPGRFESLAKISELVVEAAQAAGLDEEAVYGVQLAVDEAASNIIEHAYGGENVGDIECTIEIIAKGLKIVLKDHGKPFDPDVVPHPDLDSPLEDRQPGGLGLFFMSRLMDEIEFEFTPGGNILTLVKYR